MNPPKPHIGHHMILSNLVVQFYNWDKSCQKCHLNKIDFHDQSSRMHCSPPRAKKVNRPTIPAFAHHPPSSHWPNRNFLGSPCLNFSTKPHFNPKKIIRICFEQKSIRDNKLKCSGEDNLNLWNMAVN